MSAVEDAWAGLSEEERARFLEQFRAAEARQAQLSAKARIVSEEGDDLLTVGEAAEVAGVRPATVYRWIREGYLPAAGIDTIGGRDVRVYYRRDVMRVERDKRRRGGRRLPGAHVDWPEAVRNALVWSAGDE